MSIWRMIDTVLAAAASPPFQTADLRHQPIMARHDNLAAVEAWQQLSGLAATPPSNVMKSLRLTGDHGNRWAAEARFVTSRIASAEDLDRAVDRGP
jgi:hypothetical protein